MFRFNGCEIVKLKHDLSDVHLKTGDCGVIWGVYEFNPPLYEATFIDCDGNEFDAMFSENDVEEVLDFIDTPYPKRLEEIRRLSIEFEAKLEKENKI